MNRGWFFFVICLFVCSFFLNAQSTRAQDVFDWPIWVYPTATGGDETVNYMTVGDVWLSESWYIPVDFTGGPKTETLYVTIQDLHPHQSVSDVILIVALNPAAHDALSQVDVSPSTEGSRPIGSFILVDGPNVPRGINLNQHIYKDYPPIECYFYEFHVASSIGEKGSTSPPDHVDLTVTLHIKTGVASSEGVYVHFDCSALKNSDIVVNPFSHDTNTVAAPPQLVHDVAATYQVPTPTTVPQGNSVNIDVTVWNIGGFTETFTVACYYDHSQIGTQTVTDLAPNTPTHISFTWNTASVAPGIYYIKAMADYWHVITETNEDNNNCTTFDPVTVYVSGLPGELSVDKAQTNVISGPDPPIVGSTTEYQLTMTVANTGGSTVTSVMVQDIISSDVTFISVGSPSKGSVVGVPPPITWSVGNLLPGSSATLAFRVSVTPTNPGLLYLNHKADLSASGDTDTTHIHIFGHTDVTVTTGAPPPPPPQPAAVGGEWVPMDKLQLIVPWMEGFALTIALAASFVCIKRIKKHQD
jgi:uncharacterized repeat protein (TIGR01451 family)